MNGSAEGVRPSPNALTAEPGAGPDVGYVGVEPPSNRKGVRHDLVEALAREPFVLVVLALDAVILCLSPSARIRSDTWLVLVAGRLVSNNGLPHEDALTIWAHGKGWVDQQWLGQLLFYWIHAAGGMRLLLFVHVLLLVLGFTLALAFGRRAGGSSRSVALVGIVALFVALPNSAARAQSFAYVLFVLLFWLLAADSRTPSRRVLLALPLLVLWGNLHGSAVLGAGLVAVWAAAGLICLGWLRGEEARLARVRCVAVAGAAFLCLLVSPYGLDVVGYYRDVLGAGAFRDLVTEWGPTTLSNEPLFFVLAIGSVWLAARKPRALTLFEHLALIGLLFSGLGAVRNAVWFALAAAMVVPRALDAVWPVAEAELRRRVNIVLSLFALALVGVSLVSAVARAPVVNAYPDRAAEFVSSAARRDPSLRVFANEAFADWLLWRVPALAGRVAFDARFELLSSRQLRAVVRFRHQTTPQWAAAAAGYRLLVLDPRTEMRVYRSFRAEPGTRILFRNEEIAVLLRRRGS
jgi:hypothetical protein